MIYRTLHSYILRELLRIFLMTASALTTLMAFGGMFKPVTKQGIDVSQLMEILLNLMPAMMAYAIPIAALFAAVLVYWRMSTDNELTACRAGGVSFISIVLPAFILGLVVASADLVFLNYVVPRFLQATERAVVRDMGSLVVSQITHQERFQFDKYVVTADEAELLAPPDSTTSRVLLHGMALTILDKYGKPGYTVVSQIANVDIHTFPATDSAEITFSLTNGTAFDPGNAFRKVAGSVEKLTRPIPSLLKSKPKFLNLKSLQRLAKDPWSFPPISEAVQEIQDVYTYDQLGGYILKEFESRRTPGNPRPTLVFIQRTTGNDRSEVTVQASGAVRSTDPPDRPVTFSGDTGAPVKVEQRTNGKLIATLTCDAVDLGFSANPFAEGERTATLYLRGNVKQTSSEPGQRTVDLPEKSFVGLLLDELVLPADRAVVFANAPDPVHYAQVSRSPAVREMGVTADRALQKLSQSIDSELNSRGSFALSCLTLVMFGAALGILLRGKNPLAVFVLGFVPAIVLVLLITAGRQVTEGNPRNVTAGIAMIWAGNGVLILLVAGVYFRLLRR